MNKRIRKFYMTLIYLFLYAPIFLLFVFSFNKGKTRGLWEGFSFHWYRSLFQNEEIMAALQNTITVALLATFFGTLIASLGIIGLYYCGKKEKKILMILNQINVINPEIVTAVGFLIVYRFINLDLGYFSLLLSHIGFTVPYVILSILPRLQQMPSSLPEAAMDLGATPLQTVRYVIFPYIRPAIISGALMAFTISVDDFAISFFTTGSGVDTVSTLVYSMARRGINPEINALSALMFVAMIVLLTMVNIRTAKEKKKRKRRLL